MKKTYCAPDMSTQYISLHSAIMSGENPDQGNNVDPNQGSGLGAPARTLYI